MLHQRLYRTSSSGLHLDKTILFKEQREAATGCKEEPEVLRLQPEADQVKPAKLNVKAATGAKAEAGETKS